MNRNYLMTGLIAFVVTTLTLGFYHLTLGGGGKTLKVEHVDGSPSSQAVYTLDNNDNVVPLDFTTVANKVMDGVVHIKSVQTSTSSEANPSEEQFQDLFRNSPFGDLFGQRFRNDGPSQPDVRVGSGSGVIISADGYIVTNNHVIADADDIEVTLHDNRTFKATVIGADPTTDVAVIQIKANDLKSIPFANSDEVKVGEWVMAVGNPFNLTSTVTAGIVSAKARNINLLREQYAVESFIQTDAAINPGNSGGALVNLQGALIGINTAIASPTGAYSGYGFAVPSNIVSKVVEDLMKYGVVQRGVLGVLIRTVDGNFAKEKNLSVNSGAYVDSLLDSSAGGAAGLKPGDVIIEVDGMKIESSPRLQEIIAQHRPGDKLNVKALRNAKEKSFDVTLNNRNGNMGLVKKEQNNALSVLGADFETLDKNQARKLDIKGGVKVKELNSGKLRKYTTMRPGFIITKVDGQPVYNVEDLANALEGRKGGVMLEGVYEDLPGVYYYAFGM